MIPSNRFRLFQPVCLLLGAIVLWMGVVFSGGASALALPQSHAVYLASRPTPNAASQVIEDPALSDRQSNYEQLQEKSGGVQQAAENINENTRSAFGRTADNIREKLNLDEPVPDSTKDFLNDVRDTVTNSSDSAKNR